MKRIFVGAKFDPVLYERIKKYAKSKQISPRAVLEQCVDAALPEMEKATGLNLLGEE